MTLYFSPLTGGFYDDAFNTSIPEDKVEVTMAERETLLSAQRGDPTKAIMAGSDGKPILAERILSVDEAMALLRRRRNVLLRRSDKTQFADFPLTEAEREACAAYRAALRDLPETYATDPAAAVWPEPPMPGII